ncbi:chemerin-like receptor 1 isoform X1 [Lates calcarifer]|uniref:Chemerin-like receptor 1 isoform X1 n=2 Tax=Lates calcarifer TaxID=8187 RepID=A0AAJ7PZD5_LATCA|nr:chemerin-like receptor 1 isoform X1 [Lates calcarifer]
MAIQTVNMEQLHFQQPQANMSSTHMEKNTLHSRITGGHEKTQHRSFSDSKTMMELMTVDPFYIMNTTDVGGRNGSLYEDDEEYDYDHTELKQSLNIMSLIVYSLAFVLGVLGNGVVIWVTGFKMKKTVNTVWFLNLAVADFLFTAFLPLSVTYTAMDFHWPFGNFMCKVNSTISFLNMFASVYILVVISVDRCVSVVWPVWAQNHRSVRKASFVSLGVWVLALILSGPYFIFKDTGPSYHNENIINCFTNFALSDDYETPSVTQLRHFRHQAMTITRFLLGFVVPFTVIVSCYAVIIHRLRRNRTLASQSSRPFKIIAAVITTFFLCWAPYHIMGLIEMVNHTVSHSSEILDQVTTIGVPIATSLAFLNSCLNPLLYVFMGQDFKDKVRKSILNVLETAFQEEVSRSYTYTNSMVTSRSKEKSVSDAEV